MTGVKSYLNKHLSRHSVENWHQGVFATKHVPKGCRILKINFQSNTRRQWAPN